MTNVEMLEEAHEFLNKTLTNAECDIDSFKFLNCMISIYLPSIARSLAVIADKMSEEK